MNSRSSKVVQPSRRRGCPAALLIASLIAGLLVALGIGATGAAADDVGEGHSVLFAVHAFSIGGSAYDARAPRPCITPLVTDEIRQRACGPLQKWSYTGFGHGGFELQESRIDHPCLAATSATAGARLILAPCDPHSDLQRWFLSGPADSATLRLWFHFGMCLTATADGADGLDTCGTPLVTSQLQQLTVMWTRVRLAVGIDDRASAGTRSTWNASIVGQNALGEQVRAGFDGQGGGFLQTFVLPGEYTLSVNTTGPGQTYSGGWAAWPATTASPLQTLETSSPAWGPYARGVNSTGLLRVRVPNDPALAFDTAVTYGHQVDNAPVS